MADEKKVSGKTRAGGAAKPFPWEEAIAEQYERTKSRLKGLATEPEAELQRILEQYLPKKSDSREERLQKLEDLAMGFAGTTIGKGVLPTAAREQGLQKFLEPSAVKERLYHGTSRPDLTEFKTGKMIKEKQYPGNTIEPWAVDNRDAVFLTPSPQFSGRYSGGDWEISGGYTPTTYPVRVQVKNPWDYENPEHIESVIQAYKEKYPLRRDKSGAVPSEESLRHHWFEKNVRELPLRERDNWSGVEKADLQEIIRSLGHDAFFVKESGIKNLGVYDPRKIKSAIGNRGTYDITDPDITKAEGGLAQYGLRHSGEGVKGKGYFGPMAGRDGTVTELSAEDESGEFPLVVPTLTAEELDRLLAGGEPTPEMLDKASSWAATRRKRGESPFASPTELRMPRPKAEGGSVNLTDLPDEVNPSNWREHLQNNVLADARALLGAKDGGVINLDELIEKSLEKKEGGVINLDELIDWTLAKAEHRKMKEGGAVKMQGGGNPGEVAGDMFKPKPLSIPEPITSLVEALRRQFEKEKRSLSKPGATQDILLRGPASFAIGAPADIVGMGGELLDYAQKKIPALRKPASVMDTGPEKVPPMGYAPMFPLSPEGSYGTAATQELFGKAGLTTKEERPLAELTTGVLAPFAVSPTIKAAKAAGKALAPTATDFLDLQLGNLMKPYQMSVVPEGGPKLSKEEYSRMMREKYAAQNLAKQEKPSLKAEEVKAPADDLGLYSPAEKAALNLKRNIGTGEAFLSDLRKAPDVGEADLLHTGLEDWLKSKKTVSKQEIQDYMNANRVRMRQRELSGEGVSEDMQFGRPETIDDYDHINSEAEYYIDNIDDYHPGFLDEAKERLTQKAIDDGDDVSDPRVQSWIESSAQEELANYANDMARDMYYDNPYRRWSNNAGYEIIGNDDVGYTVRSPNGDVVNRREIYDFETAEGIAQSHGMDNGYGGAGSTQYSEYQLAGPSSNYREHLTQIDRSTQRSMRENELNDLARQMNQATDPIEKDRLLNEYNRLKEDVYEIYSGAHHDYEDIMSHSRTQDRVSDEGKNILHVDELQSDMHQDGAEFGYKTPELKQREKTLINEREAVIDQFQEARDKLQELIDARDRAAYRMSTDINNLPLQKEYDAAKAKVEQLGAKRDSLTNEIKDIEKAVPDAPFKKDWAEKEFKKLLTLAAKEGKDGITLSRWQDQLERWGTDSLAFRKTKTGEWVISGSKYRRLSKADLDDTITPKDVAEIMFAREGEYDCNSKEGLRDFVKKNLARGWSNAHIDRVTNKAWDQMQNLKPGEMAAIDPRKEGFKATYGKAYVEMMQKMARKYGGKMTTAKIDKGDEIIEVPYIEISGNLLKSAKKGFPYKKGGAVSKADLEREYRMAFGGGVFNTDPDITDSGRIIPEHTI